MPERPSCSLSNKTLWLNPDSGLNTPPTTPIPSPAFLAFGNLH